MSLIYCPECNKEISDRSTTCIYCGFPIQDYLSGNGEYGENVCVIDGLPFDLSEFKKYVDDVIDEDGYISRGEAEELIDALCESCPHISRITSNNLIKRIIDTRTIPPKHESRDYKIHMELEQDQERRKEADKASEKGKSLISCPRCRSTSVTTGSRGYSMVWGFVGSGKTVNRCGKCGYKWEPKK